MAALIHWELADGDMGIYHGIRGTREVRVFELVFTAPDWCLTALLPGCGGTDTYETPAIAQDHAKVFFREWLAEAGLALVDPR